MENIDLKKLGERFKGLRLAAKLNQKQFGEKIGMKQQSAVSSLEKGERLPTTEQLAAASEYFQKNISWLLYGIQAEIRTADPESGYASDKPFQVIQEIGPETSKPSSPIVAAILGFVEAMSPEEQAAELKRLADQFTSSRTTEKS